MPARAVGEPNEVNNTRLTTIRIGADLTVTGLTVPARGAAGEHIAVTDTTRNTGSGSAGVSATAFYLSTNLIARRDRHPAAAGAAGAGARGERGQHRHDHRDAA